MQKRFGGVARFGMRFGAAFALVAALGAGVPSPALAYYNRGGVSVEAAVTSLQVHAGKQEAVTLKVTPSSDDQTEGCGMPSCPQGCSKSCFDKNGQCICAGKEYKTYYPTVTATSSDPSVAVATADAGSLTVYAKQAGDTVITLRASLRQFDDATTQVKVHVEGTAADAAGSPDAYTQIPAAAEAGATQPQQLDIVKKTIMKRPVWSVRINDAADPAARLREMAGTDGDVTFWSGDTSYHPAYSLTFCGKDYQKDAVGEVDPSMTVERDASGEFTQPLNGLDGFLVMRFAQQGAFPASAKAYVQASDVFTDDTAIDLFRYDAQTRTFSRVDADAKMSGGYATFTVKEGGAYVLSSRDLEHDSTKAVKHDAAAASDSHEDMDMSGMDMGSMDMGSAEDTAAQPQDSGLPFAVPLAVGIIAVAVVVVALVVRARKDRGSVSAGAPADSDDAATDEGEATGRGEDK